MSNCRGEVKAVRKEMEKDRRRRQTPSVHPGSRKPLISMEGASLDGWREGGGRNGRWRVRRGVCLTENDLKGHKQHKTQGVR